MWWDEVLKWVALNIGPAIPFIFSGAFSVWALVLKMRSDAAKRADDVAREAREDARRKQEATDREVQSTRMEAERQKNAAYERAERMLTEERERSGKLLADKLHDMNFRMQSLQSQLDLCKAEGEKDALTIQRLRERIDEVNELVAQRDKEISAAMNRESDFRRHVTALEAELKHLRSQQP